MPTPDGRHMYAMTFLNESTGEDELQGADTLPPLVESMIPGYEALSPDSVDDPQGLKAKFDLRASYLESLADQLQPQLLAEAVAERLGEPLEAPLSVVLGKAQELGLLSATGRQVMSNACKLPHIYPVFDGEWDELVPLVFVSSSYVAKDGGFLPKPRGNVLELDPLDERVFLMSLDAAGLVEFHSLVPEDAATVEA